ncbi:MAG TPA: molybdenum cofactor guanylyltransferase MobA [Rhodanobacter sp.]|nr:molybdenum cofactor guanylyltransferase MobA [Rhodanobacter sp.]
MMVTTASGAAPQVHDHIVGLILAGGRGTRMGGKDKGLVEFNGKPMVEHVLAALRPQVAEVFISANRNEEVYRKTGCTVVSDALTGFAGPLAGVSAAMHAATRTHVLVLPCDGPFVPAWLAQRLWAASGGKDDVIVAAHDGERLQPTFALLPVSVLDDLDAYLAGGGHKIDTFYYRHAFAPVDFSDYPQAFLNINTPDDVEKFAHLSGG